ncbi:MAG: hypothetical protein ACK4M9_22665 [Anaerobacillus sp.]|uniref:hypothetical protein n=1 Tax=Anaerobacillus sp. TaxID=1872506 RepID=UPI00391B9D2B
MDNFLESKSLDLMMEKCMDFAAQGIATFAKVDTEINPNEIVGSCVQSDILEYSAKLPRLIEKEVESKSYRKKLFYDFFYLKMKMDIII